MLLFMRTWSLLLVIVTMGYSVDTPEDIATKAYQANINALMVFTSQEGLNSGHYRFTNVGVTMDMAHLPFIYHLPSFQKELNLFVMGNVGYSQTRLDDPIEVSTSRNEMERLDYDNRLQTYTGGLGVGVRYQSEYGVDFLAGVEFIYSRTGVSVRQPDDDIGDAIESFFAGKYNNNLTYKLLAQLEYHKEYEGFEPYAKSSYRLYETKADLDFDELSSFETQASVISLGVGIGSPKLYTYEEMYLRLEGYLYGHYLGGDITEVVGLDHYSSVGAVAYWYTEDSPIWAERFFLELSTVNSSGLEGYNLGVGFTLDF